MVLACLRIWEMNAFQKFAVLWKVTPKDCKFDLICEFCMNAAAFERRFQEERDFQLSIGAWKE
jgi:hypothetical protein